MKKTLAWILALAMVLGAYGAFAEGIDARRLDSAADADEWAAIFLGEHPEELDAWAMTDQMAQAMPALGGMKGLAASLAGCGALGKVYPAYEDELQGYRVFNIPCAFALQPLDIVLVVQDGALAGLNFGPFTGKDEEPDGAPYESVELALPVPALNGELPGTLTLPKGEGPFPTVILIHGSGPSDRDETVGGVKPFRDLAEGLAAKGIAVYRFDKRTYVYGAQMAANKQATLMDESVDDAVAAVQLLAGQERIDPDRVFVLGHSLGGNAIPAVARELEQSPVGARGFIMMAASPRQLDELMREQYEFLYSLLPELTPDMQAEKDAAFAELDRLEGLDAMSDDEIVLGAYAPYWKWLRAYDVLGRAAEIGQPVLVLQGEEDYQVSMADFGVWQETFGGKDNWTLISYPGLTHPFTEGQKAEGSAIYNRAGKMDQQVIDDIAEFVLRK